MIVEREDNDLEQVTGSPTAGESGFVHVDPIDSASMDGSSINQDDGVVVTRVDSVQDEPSDLRMTEDGGNEEFVDCPDDLVSYDGRTGFDENGETEVVAESQLTFGDVTEDNQQRLREILPHHYQDERKQLMTGISSLHCQLKDLIRKRSLIGGNDAGLFNDEATVVGDDKSLPLHELINDCYRFIDLALSDQSQLEGTIRELYATLDTKEREITDLLKKDEETFVETTVDRILSSLANVVGEQEFLDISVTGKLLHLETSTSLLIQKHTRFLSEVEMVNRCLAEVKPGYHMEIDIENVLFSTREELLELKKRELELTHKSSYLEDNYGKLMEQLYKSSETVKILNSEIGKLKGEVEAEKTRYITTREKLSLAVTKGKSLVQHRDSLKQVIVEKTNELDKCLIELQEKSSALEAAELRNEEMFQIETFASSLKEALLQRDMVLEKCKDILSLHGVAEELHSSDVINGVTWLANERNRLTYFSLEFQKLNDALSSLKLPEAGQQLDMVSQVSWLLESFNMAKDQSVKLQDEIDTMKEAAREEIDRLTVSLLVEAQKKNYLEEEFRSLTHKYEGIVKEQEDMVTLFLDASGILMDRSEDSIKLHSDMAMVIDQCLSRIKENAIASYKQFPVKTELLEKFQDLLYERDQECKLYEQILEEEKVDRLELNKLSTKITRLSEELRATTDKNGSLRLDLQQSEDKAALLKEKLSMAVKKGKGLVQERVGIKQQMAEKDAQIEALELEIKQQDATMSGYKDQISKLSSDMERIMKLESDLLRSKEERDRIEQFLVESNTILQRMVEATDDFIIPVDLTEPVEKVKWCAAYLNECQIAKVQAEQELKDVKNEANILASKLTNALATMKSLEDALSASEKHVFQLTEERQELEERLHKALEEATFQTNKFEDIIASKNLLQEALVVAEENISLLKSEKEEAVSHEHKFMNACATIKTLDDALLKAESTISVLVAEKKNTEQEISNLNTELSACRKELACKNDNRFSELLSFLDELQVPLKDERLLTWFKRSLEKTFKIFVEMDHHLKDIKDYFDIVRLPDYPVIEESFQLSTLVPPSFDNALNTEITNSNIVDADDIASYAGKTLEKLNLRNQIFSDEFGRYSAFIDELTASLLVKLEALRNTVPFMVECTKTLQENVNNLQIDKQALEDRVVILEHDIKFLRSACANVTENLKFLVENNTLVDDSASSLYIRVVEDVAVADIKVAEEMLLAARSVKCVIDHGLDVKQNMSMIIKELQAELEKTRLMYEKAKEENENFQNRVFKLEMELEASQKLHTEMILEGTESDLMSASEIQLLLNKINGITTPFPDIGAKETEADCSIPVKKLFYIIDSVNDLLDQITLLSKQALQVELLKEKLDAVIKSNEDSEKIKKEISELSVGFERIIRKFGGDAVNNEFADVAGLLPVLENLFQGIVLDSENSKAKAQDVGVKLQETQKVAEELASKLKLLEDFNQSRTGLPDAIHERSVLEASSLPPRSEISEVEDPGSIGKQAMPLASSAAHARTLWRGPNDHLALNIDPESDRLIGKQETVEDKGHSFKSLHTSGLVPAQGKIIADRLDGIWVSGGRALMNRPRARLGLITYCVVLHLWLLGTLL